MVSIKPCFPPNWTPDEEVMVCARCSVQFTMINRKHHCRACGKIFCGQCSAYTASIPSYVHKVYSGGGGLRLCSGCNMLVMERKRSKRMIFIFSILPLRVKELEVLLQVNREWNSAATYIIGIFKAIQYKTGYKKWLGIERRLLSTHWREFVGHNRLMVQVLKGLVGVENLSKFARHFKCSKKNTSCKDLYCHEMCCSEFQPYDVLELLFHQQTTAILETQEIESWIGTVMNHMHPNWLIKFLPWFLQMGKTPAAQRLISNNIIPLALDNIDFAYSIYFECELLRSSTLKSYYIAIQSRLMSGLPTDLQEDIRRSHKFLRLCEDPKRLMDPIKVEGIRLPYDPNTIVKGIDHKGIRQLSSFTKPWVIPMQTTRGRISILQKCDDLRKDRLVVTTMHIMMVLEPSLVFHTYHVFPITSERGWVEMIPNAKTVYDIDRNSSIQNYIISFNRNKSAESLRCNFMYSCASNCVLGYMLGLGDRNLHNILVCGETATLAHIDFSYLLGHDPKNIESTEMKITSGMVDMLGGYNSDEFETLKYTCTRIYNKLRVHTYFWYVLFRYLVTSKPDIYPHGGDLKTLQTHVENRLMPSATEEEVKVAIVKSVDSNSGSWKSSISDMAHSLQTNLAGMMFNLEL